MQEIPDCLNRRYKVLDELVKELSSVSDVGFNDDASRVSHNDPGVRLMCDFWNILKENPDCNLTKALQHRMDLSPRSSMFQPQNVSCYMACSDKGDDAKKPDSGGKVTNQCCHRGLEKIKSKCCGSKSLSSSQASTDALPLSKVLCNLNEAASFDRKCQGMINDLMAAQKQLQDQIQHLEHREEEGVELLKKADCMWSCMEDAYKKKILESQERQQELIKQLKEAEANTNKWRKNKKDLDLQMENVNTCHQEISEKLQQKQNDLKCMNRDITDYKKRIENNKKEIDAAKKSVSTKKNASDDRIKKISGDLYKREAMIREEKARKEEKENEGNQYIREARADLLNLSKILLQKKIENEDLKTEKETIIDELEILSQSYDQCKDRCQFKKQSMEEEIKKIDNEITHYQAKCLRCHQCTDTIDIRKFCTDCPRCLEERECLYKEDHCSPDHTMDCVCMSVKQKFLDNVFENMYTVLERQIKTGPGKCVAETVLNCLKKSRNGKLDQQTRQILQDFILTTVKKNLNLTIVGGAVKTRCELDSETYKQLMLCLKQVKAVRPPKADKQTAAKKPPCSHWGGETECNCPKGPKGCICTKRAPPLPNEPGPCPPQDEEDKGEEKICPHKESTACGPDCAMHAVPSAVGTDVAAWRPDPCKGPSCMFKNMRAAQCVLGPEALNNMFDNKSFVTAVPYVPKMTTVEDQISCRCGSSASKACTCKEVNTHPRERIIEEVMGKYFEVKPIDKVCTNKDCSFKDNKIRGHNENIYVCVDTPVNKNKKKSKSVATQNSKTFYDDIYKMEKVKNVTNDECMSKYVYKDMIEKHVSHNFDNNIYFESMRYFKADLKHPIKSYLESATSVMSLHSKKIPTPENNQIMIDNNSVLHIISKNNCKTLKDRKKTLLSEEVCTIAQKLIKDIIMFGCESKKDSSKEWISLQTFINEILDKPRMKVEENDPENIEVEIKSEYLENSGKVKIQNKDTKQMKVETRTQCDDKICGNFASNLVKKESFSSRPQNNLIVDGGDPKCIIHKTKNNQCDPMEKLTVDNKLKADLIREQFQPLFITKSIQNGGGLLDTKELLQNNLPMSSELSKLDIDEHVIEIIENITRKDPSSYVSLRKSKSGHLTLDLNSANDDDGQSLIVKRSPSGDMIIEIEKNAILNTRLDKLKKELHRNKNTKTDNMGSNVAKAGRTECNKIKENCHDGLKQFLLHNFKKKFSACKSNRETLSKDFLQKMYENNLRNVTVRLKHQCNKSKYVQAALQEISSESIGIHIKHGSIVDASRLKLPVLVERTESGTIYIDALADVTSCNGVAIRTASNGFLIHIDQPNSQEIKPFKQNLPKTQNVFKIKIKGLDNGITEPPAVIKRTPSGNFDVVIEKEYEKYFQQTIRDQTIDENESFFDLTKNSSSVILDFEKNNDISNSQKALLMKSNSGLLKIIVSDASANEQKEKRKNSVTFGSKMSAKALEHLLTKLPSISKLKRDNPSRTITKKTKSSSDSHLYETAKMKLHSSQSLLEESSTTLKKTPSGHYAVVLDKDLKKSFINNLLSYLDKSSNGVIPIKRTASGDITISFDKNTRIGESGSLKITPSGNIYIVLDEGHIKRISNNIAINTSNTNRSDISPYTSKSNHLENKAIATNCNACPNDSLCDASKCICERLTNERDSLEYSVVSPNESHKLCGKNECYGQRKKQSIMSNNKSPRIVIRSCESRPESDKRNKFQESYYCEVQSVCPYHKDRYEGISNELLEISGSCYQAQQKVVAKGRTLRKIKQFMPEKKVTYDWNSFDYLPHQLPPFLKNITYS